MARCADWFSGSFINQWPQGRPEQSEEVLNETRRGSKVRGQLTGGAGMPHL